MQQNIIPCNDYLNQLPGLWVLMDLNSKFLAANDTALEWTGFSSREAMLGKTYADMPCRAAEEHKNFIDQDHHILKTNRSGKIFGLYCYQNNDWKVILAEKFILKNDHQKIGLVSYISDLTHSGIVNINKFISMTSRSKHIPPNQSGYILEGNLGKISLTTRQSECLFFVLRGKSAREISEILFLSPRTIEKYIEDLKIKFQCKTKSELIEKAIYHDYLYTIPQSLFNLFK